MLRCPKTCSCRFVIGCCRPWPRFIVVFFCTYMLEFMVFAFLFWAQVRPLISSAVDTTMLARSSSPGGACARRACSTILDGRPPSGQCCWCASALVLAHAALQTDRCVINLQGKFAHALWLSSRTASTLGFDSIRPNPECPLTNLTVMLQVRAPLTQDSSAPAGMHALGRRGAAPTRYRCAWAALISMHFNQKSATGR